MPFWSHLVCPADILALVAVAVALVNGQVEEVLRQGAVPLFKVSLYGLAVRVGCYLLQVGHSVTRL